MAEHRSSRPFLGVRGEVVGLCGFARCHRPRRLLLIRFRVDAARPVTTVREGDDMRRWLWLVALMVLLSGCRSLQNGDAERSAASEGSESTEGGVQEFPNENRSRLAQGTSDLF